ncbi:MAG: PAS domain S-box protein, partial [Verrucomicrobia bacterium]|nr:PAS domain S-box protein [Verrucomicrobiota bacterium]
YRADKCAELAAIARLKTESIQLWRQERLRDGRDVFEATLLPVWAREFLSQPGDPARRDDVLRWMDNRRRNHSYRRAQLLDLEFRVRLTAPAGDDAVDGVTVQAARDAVRQRQLIVTDLHLDSAGRHPSIDVVVPLLVRGETETPVGVLVLEIDPGLFLLPHIQNWPIPSRTAETLLVRREGTMVRYLNTLRHRADTALRLTFPLDQRELPAVRAVLGETGVVEGIDYRGEKVLAAMFPVPDSPWFLVAKQDLAEVDEPVHQWIWALGAMVTILMGAATAGIGFVWRTREMQFLREEVAERARVETGLQAAAQQLHETQRIARLGSYVLEVRTGRWTSSAVLDEIFGLSDPAFIRDVSGWLRLVHPADREEMSRYFEQEVIGARKPFDREYRIVRLSDGAERWVHGMGELVLDEHGAPVSMLGSIQDISERREYQIERERLLKELEEKNADLESMIYIASHDLRAPLVNVQGFGQRLEAACADLVARSPAPARETPTAGTASAPERIAKALHYIRTSANRMDHLLNGLLRVSRLGRIQVDSRSIDLNATLREVLATFESQVQKAGAEVRVEPLPSCQGDPQLLGQLFANLLDNALKYRAPERALRIAVSAQRNGHEVVYCVADTGLGIAPEHQAKIWEMFHRLHPGGPVAGEGLGLKIVRRIVQQHCGRVWVESAAGEGSRFYVALPATAEG